MNNQPSFHKRKPILFFLVISFLASFFLPSEASAQKNDPEEEEVAVCKVKVKDKEYPSKSNKPFKDQQIKSNSVGYFMKVYGLDPLDVIPIVVMYPKGKSGEKVVLSAVHGGTFDNKKQVQVVQLDNQKKCTFTFQLTSHPGLFEITLRRGNDVKVVSLWVGEE